MQSKVKLPPTFHNCSQLSEGLHTTDHIFKPGTHRLACIWFLKTDLVRIVGMHVCVCVSTPEAINN